MRPFCVFLLLVSLFAAVATAVAETTATPTAATAATAAPTTPRVHVYVTGHLRTWKDHVPDFWRWMDSFGLPTTVTFFTWNQTEAEGHTYYTRSASEKGQDVADRLLSDIELARPFALERGTPMQVIMENASDCRECAPVESSSAHIWTGIQHGWKVAHQAEVRRCQEEEGIPMAAGDIIVRTRPDLWGVTGLPLGTRAVDFFRKDVDAWVGTIPSTRRIAGDNIFVTTRAVMDKVTSVDAAQFHAEVYGRVVVKLAMEEFLTILLQTLNVHTFHHSVFEYNLGDRRHVKVDIASDEAVKHLW